MPPSDKKKLGHKDALNKGDKLTQELLAKSLCKDAHASKCIWARVKGYPWWPAQVLSKAAAKQHLGNVTHKSKSDIPVIFFGTSEIAWIGCKDVTGWEEGMRQSFHSKGRKNKRFVVALEQVRDFLSITSDRFAPHGWWCVAPARNAPPLPDELYSSEEEDNVLEEEGVTVGQVAGLPRQFSAIGRYGMAAIAAAAAAVDGNFQTLQHGAASAVDRAAGAAVAGCMARHSNDAIDEECGSRRPLHSRQQLWASSRRPSDTGTGHIPQYHNQQQVRHPRSSNTGYGYAHDSGSDQEQQQDEEVAGAGYLRGMHSHRVSREDSKAPCNGYIQRKKRQLLQQECYPDGTGSEGDMTDTESVAMAAMAIAELAQCSSWDQRHHEATVDAPGAAAEMEEEPLMQVAAGAPGMKSSQHKHDDGLVRVKFEVQADSVGVDVLVKSDAIGEAAAAVTGCHLLQPHFGLPPRAAGFQQHKSHLTTLGCLVAAAGLDSDQPTAEGQQPVLPVHPPGKYEHGGEGLPCSCSWKYTVAVPSVAVAVIAPPVAGSICSSPTIAAGPQIEHSRQESLDSDAQMGQQSAAAGAHQKSAAAAAAASSAVAQQHYVPAVSVCVGSAYYRHLFAGFGHTIDVDEAETADETNVVVDDSQQQAAVLAPVVERLAAAAAAAAPLAPRRSRAFVPKYVAAANAAIMAAFSGGVSSPAAAAAAGGGSSSSAARSEGSGGSASASGHRAAVWQRKRSHTNSGVSAAAAAAAAAAHVLTPADPVLDPHVGRLLLDYGPVLPHPQDNYLGFQLPREMLLNRPPRFEMLKRNLFVSRERPKRLPKDEVSVCCCRVKKVVMPDGSVQHIGCDNDCLNRLSFIHCDPRTCPCGPYCTNKPFHLLKAPELDVFLTQNRGHGVRVNSALPAGTFVMEYAGEVIDQAELSRRMEAARDSGEQHFYIMEMGPGLFIDARKKGNYARLLNSCCDPNCETQKWRDAATGEVRIGIFTTREVSGYEELTYDYMFEHYGLSSGLAQGFKCQCGAKNCRGTMDINPERKRDWGRRLEVFWEGDGVFYRGTVTGYSTTSGKHTIMYDDGDTERVNLSQVPHRWLDGDASPHSSAQLPSGSPAPGVVHGPRPSPLPVTQPVAAGAAGVLAAAAEEAANSGDWSQTEQEAAAGEQMLSSPRAMVRTGHNRAARVLGLSPLGPAGAAGKAFDYQMPDAAAAFGATAGVKRPAHLAVEESLDDEAAADALVELGMAAEAELAGNEQQQLVPDDVQFQRPPAKRRCLDVGGDPQAVHRSAAQWPHSSSTSSQSACATQVGFAAGAVDGASPLSPAGRAMNAAGKALPGINHHLGARGGVRGPTSPISVGADGAQIRAAAAAMSSTGDEYLPWEQLVSGISAIKRQGPSLFQPGSAAAKPVPVKGPSAAAAEAFRASRNRFGQLLSLVGQMQPVIQQKQLLLGSVASLGQADSHCRPHVNGVTVQANSLGISSTSSNSAAGQLPLFLFADSLRLQQQQRALGKCAPAAGSLNYRPQEIVQQQSLGRQCNPVQQMDVQRLQAQQVATAAQGSSAVRPSNSGCHPEADRCLGNCVADTAWHQQLMHSIDPQHLVPGQQQQQQQAALLMRRASVGSAQAGSHQQQQHSLQVCQQPVQYHRSSASFTGSTTSSFTALQHPSAAAIDSGVVLHNSVSGQRVQQQLKQLSQYNAPAANSAVPVRVDLPLSVGPGSLSISSASAAAANLQHLQALKAAAAVAAGLGPSAGTGVGTPQHGSLGSAGSGGSPVSAGSFGTVGGNVAAVVGDVRAVAGGGLMGMLQTPAVVQ